MHSSTPASGKQNNDVLIVDKSGTLGNALARALAQDRDVVLVSKRQPEKESSIIYIPYGNIIPTIPDSTYAATYYFFEKETKELLAPLMKKAAEDNANFFVVVSHNKTNTLSEALLKKQLYGQAVVVGDIFGEKTTELDRWLYEVKDKKKLMLSGMGLSFWYPIVFADVIEELANLSLLSHRQKQLYLLAPTHPVTELTIAHALQKIDPTLGISFGEGGNNDDTLVSGTPLLKDYQAIEKIANYYKKIVVKEEETSSAASLAKVSRKTKKKWHLRHLLLFFFYTIIVFLAMPILVFIITGELGKYFLFAGVDNAKKGAFSQAVQNIQAAKTDFNLSLTTSGIVQQELSLINQSQGIFGAEQELSTALLAANTLSDGVGALQKIEMVLKGKSPHPTNDTEDAANTLKATLILLQKLQTSDISSVYKNKLKTINSYLPIIEASIDNLPQLLGTDGKREYLVLFQNNTELRPGGGFIGSYGILTLSRGAFKTFSVHDVYDADGQLKGHVEPPFALRRYIPVVHLYLRDSNFDVDFVKNAQEAAFLLKAETGDTVDGVVGIDLSFVGKIISAMNSVYVPSTKDTVTEKNLFLLTEQHAEKNFFPGSTQKKDFLSDLFSAMQEKLHTASPSVYEGMGEQLMKSIDEKHLLLASLNPVLEEPFRISGFSSSLIDTREKDPNVLTDFLGISEANVGGNKVNYYLQRNVSQNVIINSEGSVTDSVTLTLENLSTGQWPGGAYKDYLRFILPEGAVLASVLLNGVEQQIVPAVTDSTAYEAKSFVPPLGLEVERTEENGKSIYGFLVTVPTKATSTITIRYTLSQVVDVTKQTFSYSLSLFKQPGIDALPFDLHVAYPQGYAPLSSLSKWTVKNGTIFTNENIEKDTLFIVPFTQNN